MNICLDEMAYIKKLTEFLISTENLITTFAQHVAETT